MSAKIVVVGDTNVGKTSLINAYIRKNEQVSSTIAARCEYTEVEMEDYKLTLQLWDTAGQEKYRSLVPLYFRGASCFLFIYDVTNYESFANIPEWIRLVKEKNGMLTPVCFLISNKVDLNYPKVTDEEAEEFTQSSNEPLIYFKVSALTGFGVNELFCRIASELVKNGVATEIEPKKATYPKNEKKCCN